MRIAAPVPSAESHPPMLPTRPWLAPALLGLAACGGTARVSEGFEGWPTPLAEVAVEAQERFGAPTLRIDGLQEDVPPDVVIVDVRTTEEVAVSRIPGAIVLDDEDERERFLEMDHSVPLLVYCTAGWRSAEYTAKLADRGAVAWNLEGGICAWALDGRALVDSKGRPTRRIHAYSDEFRGCVPPSYEAVLEP